MTSMIVPSTKNNAHLAKLRDRFGAADKMDGVLPEAIRYVFICFTNRCGSNYLAELLASSGKYNLAGEDLNWDTVSNISNKNGFTSFSSYFSWLSRSRSKSGVLIVKIAIAQVELLSNFGILEEICPRSIFILIERSDKLGQAISHAIAFSTGRYTSYMEGNKKPEDVEFSASLINRILNGIFEANRLFDEFFGLNGIVPINIIYEQLASNPEFFLTFIAAQAGLPDLRIVRDRLRLERQAGVVNEKWRSQYLGARSLSVGEPRTA